MRTPGLPNRGAGLKYRPESPANETNFARNRRTTENVTLPAANARCAPHRAALRTEIYGIAARNTYIGGADKRPVRDVMDWDKLRIFHAVADAGSLTHAGDTLHLSQSAVSRQIRALEESLNTTLFRRHARGLLLTEQGELLFEATRTMTKRLEATAARIRDSEDEVFGELRVTTTTGFGTLWLAPRLHTALRALPEPEDRPDARGAHPRPADARGRRGDPAEGAEPGRPDPPPADGGAHPPLRQRATTWRSTACRGRPRSWPATG